MMYDTGLILEGGGMRGTYTTGVLDFFMDHDIYFRHIYGVSAGACHACSYISKQRGRAFEIFEKYLNDERYCSLKSLRKTGNFFGVEMIYDLIPNRYIPFDYEQASVYEGELYSVVTDCRTGEPAYLRIGDLHSDMDKIRASASLPLLARTVKIDGKDYLDGGISDSIPLEESIRAGNRKNVLILTREKGYKKKKIKNESSRQPCLQKKCSGTCPGAEDETYTVQSVSFSRRKRGKSGKCLYHQTERQTPGGTS